MRYQEISWIPSATHSDQNVRRLFYNTGMLDAYIYTIRLMLTLRKPAQGWPVAQYSIRISFFIKTVLSCCVTISKLHWLRACLRLLSYKTSSQPSTFKATATAWHSCVALLSQEKQRVQTSRPLHFILWIQKYLQNGKCYSESRTQVCKYNSIRRKTSKKTHEVSPNSDVVLSSSPTHSRSSHSLPG
jgi:hypothetical protein